jgi:hypothetical protein
MDTPELLRTLVASDTTSRRSNLDLVRWVADYLDGFGTRPRLVYSDDGAKANILATLGPAAPGGIVLSGHTDVVPVDDRIRGPHPWVPGFVGACIRGRSDGPRRWTLARSVAEPERLPGQAKSRRTATSGVRFSASAEPCMMLARGGLLRISRP